MTMIDSSSETENSFTWTNTTTDDSSDSKSMAAYEESVHHNTESDYKPTKKKKSKFLNPSCNRTIEIPETKVDVKTEKESNSETVVNCNITQNLVKLKPEVDYDYSKKKKKIKLNNINSEEDYVQDSPSYDESYLDWKVKQEEVSVKNTLKETCMDISKSKDMDGWKCKDSISDIHEETVTETSIKTKKKKKKSKKGSDSEGLGEMETTKIDSKKYNKKYRSPNTNSSIVNKTDFSVSENTFQEESGCDEISAIQCEGDDNLHTLSLNEVKGKEKERKKNKDSLHKNTVVSQFKLVNNNIDHDAPTSPSVGKHMQSMSDRIQFEDDLETELLVTHDTSNDRASSKLSKFIKTNNLKTISKKLHPTSVITCEDEIWIVKCPKDIDIQTFRGTDLNIQGKGKIKVGGQTYDTSLSDEQCDTVAALSMVNGKFEVNNLPLCGIINIRKRIPKAQVHDNNTMVNNQTNFIPLPETKCRHPLFGSNYKKAIKIPTVVAKRLRAQNTVEANVKTEKKRKKHKKESRPDFEELDSKSQFITKTEPYQEPSEKKKKKRKYGDDDDETPATKRLKIIKHDPESAEAWESEKAIEQNLFDF